jgi:hypothetical protein
LVQGLLALVVSAAEACAAVTSDCVDFVDEDDAGSILLALLKEIPDAACADADEHLDEVRTGDAEERNIGFAGNSTGQQRLTGSGRSDQQHTLGDASAELLELLRLAQELDDLLQLFLGFIHAGHVFKSDLLLLHGEQACAALAERQRLVATGLHLPEHEEPDRRDQDERSKLKQPGRPASARRVAHSDIYALVEKGLVHVRKIARDRGSETTLVFVTAAYLLAVDGRFLDVACIDSSHELREVDGLVFHGIGAHVHHLPEQNPEQQDHQPEDDLFCR